MKRFLTLLIALITLFSLTACENEPLDLIEKYNINISTNDDASLNIEYELDWRVLVSSSDNTIYIGAPNKHFTIVDFDTDDVVKALNYEDEDGGTYILLHLRKKFTKGDLLKLKFTIHQTNMFTVTQDHNEEKVINYSFTPGWFEDIEVEDFTLTWDSTNVISADDTAVKVDDKYVWNKHLAAGERITCNVKYFISSFPNIDIRKSADEFNVDDFILEIIVIAVFVVLFIIIVLFFIIRRTKVGNSYYAYRGFYRNYHPNYIRRIPGVNRKGYVHHNPYAPKSSSGHSSGGSCACACACACAGGGRAGCSRKDFYKPKFKAEYLD